MPRPIILTSPYPTTEEVAERLGASREVVEAVKAMADSEMKDMARSIRRHHRERMKKKAENLYPGQEPGKFADNLTPCSCWMCTHHSKPDMPRRARLPLAALEP